MLASFWQDETRKNDDDDGYDDRLNALRPLRGKKRLYCI